MIKTLLTKMLRNGMAFLSVSLLAVTACSAQEAPVQTVERVVPTSQQEVTMSFSPLVKQAAPAVVNVFTSKVVKQTASPFSQDPFFQRFFGNQMGGVPRERVESSLGSGVIVGSDGVIVTNNHVIEGADEFKVVLADRREFAAELIIADQRTDLAVLKIDTEGEALPTLEITDTRQVEVGDLVLAIGNPFGVGQTVTTGIISAQARTDVGVSDYAFFLQTDAAINPGNSGGALVDSHGRLVGVNTAIFSRSGGSNGIGFAIPAEMVKRVVDAAVNDGQIIRPWLGLKGQAVTADIAKSMGLARPMGVLVTEIYPDGPAEKAGLKRGDLVKSIDGREVFDERGLKFLAATLAPGDKATLVYLRSGQDKSVKVKLAPPPGATKSEMNLIEGNASPFSGAEVADLSPALADELGRDPFASGVLVNRVLRRSLASRFGLRPGDMIREVNGSVIKTSDDLLKILKNQGGRGSTWAVTIERNGRRITSNIRM
ncbi:DegQ family serine endoprotease [Hirschia baltica]|uniref:Protease Do n=1 Tax=Hirschia baltica (strain ATCC 49814 / DSM 5838 / IFAM 1418) TaxID=582402 RepID=C6XLE1_HIRBI|nr:DegQ family serine endoprotease [Hirschia baltica]ACT59740.1 protease Do [Hirschia baltica ATCC 49814]